MSHTPTFQLHAVRVLFIALTIALVWGHVGHGLSHDPAGVVLAVVGYGAWFAIYVRLYALHQRRRVRRVGR